MEKYPIKLQAQVTFKDYKEPFDVKESGVLVVKVFEDNKPSSNYEITFFKQNHCRQLI